MTDFSTCVEYYEGILAFESGIKYDACPYPKKHSTRVYNKELNIWEGEVFGPWYKWMTGYCNASDARREKKNPRHLQLSQ